MQIRVYYEDTDSGGVVYYANYLRFLERARTEFLRERGIEVAAYHKEGIIFVVAHVDASYRSPARYNDLLEVETWVSEVKKMSCRFNHRIIRKDDGQLLVKGHTVHACVDRQGKLTPFPAYFLETLKKIAVD